ncbi:MAG TPA: phosphodiester glycosidase family protein [Drouetiella sp.]
MEKFSSWHELKPSDKFAKTDGVQYFEFKTANGSDAYLIVAETPERKSWQLKPIVNQSTATTTNATRKSGALASVNGAFFNLNNGESTSYITVDGVQKCDPTTNKALTGNPKLKPFLKTIFDRSELRILRGKVGRLEYSIVPHSAHVGRDMEIVHSIQAGPRLIPSITAKEEAFIRVEADGTTVDSIGVNRPAARTAFGITKDAKQIMLLCVAGKRQNEFSSGLTLDQLADLMRHLGCVEALNLDGGTSTTMSIAASDGSVQMTCGRDPETLVKTTLSVFPKAPKPNSKPISL